MKAKINDVEARRIRKQYMAGKSVAELARQLNLSYSLVYSVVYNFTHFDAEYRYVPRKKLDVKFCKRLAVKGLSLDCIAKSEAKKHSRDKAYCKETIRLHLKEHK